jgi:hypothetical protein
MKRPPAHSRSAFTLVHVVGVMALLSIFLLLGGATLVGVLKIARSAATDLQTLLAQRILADQFRADVAQAAATPDRLDSYEAGPSCLILQGPETRSIIYRWQAGQLQRAELVAGRGVERPLAVGPHIRPAFSRPGPDARLVTLRLQETQAGQTRCRLEISAALGGDRP